MSDTPPSEDAANPLSYYVSILSGACLVVSELLPYISKIKGNGILQILMNSFNSFEENKRKEDEQQQRMLQSILDRLDRLERLAQEKNSQQ